MLSKMELYWENWDCTGMNGTVLGELGRYWENQDGAGRSGTLLVELGWYWVELGPNDDDWDRAGNSVLGELGPKWEKWDGTGSTGTVLVELGWQWLNWDHPKRTGTGLGEPGRLCAPPQPGVPHLDVHRRPHA